MTAPLDIRLLPGRGVPGAIGRVGVPHYQAIPASLQMFYGNIRVGGGPAQINFPSKIPSTNSLH